MERISKPKEMKKPRMKEPKVSVSLLEESCVQTGMNVHFGLSFFSFPKLLKLLELFTIATSANTLTHIHTSMYTKEKYIHF